jgi:hypothetical protein
MKDNMARQLAAYAKSHDGAAMPRSMQEHALTQMFALQSLLFEECADESDARRELYDPRYWHALVPGSSTDPDELRMVLTRTATGGVGVGAGMDDPSSSASASSPPPFDTDEVVRRLREEGYCVLAPFPAAVATVSALCAELARIQVALRSAALPPNFIFVYNAPWQLLHLHWIGPASAILGDDSIMEADMNCWALRRDSGCDGAGAPYVGANFSLSHRDQSYSSCHDDEGEPTSVNLWSPYNISGATAENGAMRVLPCGADDFFFSPNHPLHRTTSASLVVDGAAEAVTTLTCEAGAACMWSPSLIHWGGGCNAGAVTEPRESLAVTFRAAAAPQSQFGISGDGDNTAVAAGPMILSDLFELSLHRRLAYVAKGLLAYSHWHAGFPGLALART